jgi:hypothetical protein
MKTERVKQADEVIYPDQKLSTKRQAYRPFYVQIRIGTGSAESSNG